MSGAVARPLARSRDVLRGLIAARARDGVAQPAPWAAGYLGIPFAAKGRDRGGADCWGLVRLIYREQLGIMLLDAADAYDAALMAPGATRADLGRLAVIIAAGVAPDWREEPFFAARVFDLLLLPIAGQACHVALYVGDLHILHVEEGIDAMCEDLRERRWHKRLERARLFRYAGAA